MIRRKTLFKIVWAIFAAMVILSMVAFSVTLGQ